MDFVLCYFLRASAASRVASLISPAALWADPLALSILPSVSRSLSIRPAAAANYTNTSIAASGLLGPAFAAGHFGAYALGAGVGLGGNFNIDVLEK